MNRYFFSLTVMGISMLLSHARAADVIVQPATGSSFVVKNAGGTADRLRVQESGAINLPGISAAPAQTQALCVGAAGELGPCNGSGGTTLPTGAMNQTLRYDAGGVLLANNLLQAFSDGGLVATGTVGAGNIPAIGAGSRLMWYPAKTAFRVGAVNGNLWDDANIGMTSFATGWNTVASGTYSVALGSGTAASGSASTAMGLGTGAVSDYATAAGYGSRAQGTASTAMGYKTLAGTDYSTAMGYNASATGAHSIAIGYGTSFGSINANGTSSVAMGQDTQAMGANSTALGLNTQAIGANSTAMGIGSIAQGDNSTAIGYDAKAGSTGNAYSTAIGYETEASGSFSTAIGADAHATKQNSVAIGASTHADGQSSTAMGTRVGNGGFSGSFIFGDGSTRHVVNNYQPNQFQVIATGGVNFYTGVDSMGDPNVGAGLAMGSGSWSNLSDRNAKTAVRPVNGREVLKKVIAMPLNTWQYKTQDEKYRHMGPMAQDFYAAFHLGESDTGIDTVDSEGVALAAIQGLYAELNEKNREIVALRAELEMQKTHVAALESMGKDFADMKAQIAALRDMPMPAKMTAVSRQP